MLMMEPTKELNISLNHFTQFNSTQKQNNSLSPGGVMKFLRKSGHCQDDEGGKPDNMLNTTTDRESNEVVLILDHGDSPEDLTFLTTKRVKSRTMCPIRANITEAVRIVKKRSI